MIYIVTNRGENVIATNDPSIAQQKFNDHVNAPQIPIGITLQTWFSGRLLGTYKYLDGYIIVEGKRHAYFHKALNGIFKEEQ